ncbi:hypothetical protein [Enterovibrio sp. 27052020O]|uniref:hypothetical protein n=1 Tax=Enterovibrio sp. 27052020O TaxID=3241166 RepID=UPI00388D628E
MKQITFENHHASRRFSTAYAALCCMLITSAIAPTSSQAASTTTKSTGYGYSDLYGELTPTQVYSLVKNIDSMVMHYAYKYQPSIARDLPRKIVLVNGYKPEQVFVSLGNLCDDIDRLAMRYDVPPVARVKRQANEAIPAEVFLLAGASLDTLSKTLSNIEPENNFGDFYSHRTYARAKTPSDVYALVELIHRKLTVLLGEQQQLSKQTKMDE